jgi:hypothetical protein
LISPSRAGDRLDGLRPSSSATTDVGTGSSPVAAIARMYCRSDNVARSYLLPKNPTASSPSASGAAMLTSAAVTGLAAATSQVTLP